MVLENILNPNHKSLRCLIVVPLYLTVKTAVQTCSIYRLSSRRERLYNSMKVGAMFVFGTKGLSKKQKLKTIRILV
jgi:hypothetical protein